MLDVARAERLPAPGLAPRRRRPAQLGQGAAGTRADRPARRADGLDVAADIYPYIAGQRQPLAAPARLGPGRRLGGDHGAAWARGRPDRAILRDWETELFFGWDEVEVASLEPGIEETLGLTVEAVGGVWGIDPPLAALELDPAEREPGRDGRLRPVGGRSSGRAGLRRDVDRFGRPGDGSRRPVRRRAAAPAELRLLPALPGAVRPRPGRRVARAGDRDEHEPAGGASRAWPTAAGSPRDSRPTSSSSTRRRSSTARRSRNRGSIPSASPTSWSAASRSSATVRRSTARGPAGC